MRHRPIFAAISLLSALALPVFGQEWSWPEEPKNLKVFGPEFKGERLRAPMVGFTRALGVRCSHCHVGEEGKPLATYDFASDENPNKERAREMLRMLGSVNDHLKKIEPSGPQRVNMWCTTCHRGRPRPTSLGEEMREAYDAGGVEAMNARYHELRDQFYGAGTLDFGEEGLNSFGYRLLRAGDTAGALAAFRLNVDEHPDAGNLWDSLAEAYLATGQREIAEIYYRKSLELDPANESALAKLRALQTAVEPVKP